MASLLTPMLVRTFVPSLLISDNSEDANACQDLLDDFRVNLSLSHHVITDVFITEEVVEESLFKLGRDKSDGTSLSSNHLILASPVIASFLSHLFTLIVCHGYMPIKHYVIAC